MANKPATLCQLEKNKLIDTQNGFVDTFNWTVNAIANLTGGQNCDVNWTVDDHPTIDCTVNGDRPAVYDVIPSTSESQSGIEIQYVDSRAETFIPFEGGVQFTGTNGTSGSSSNAFTFSTALDANVVVSCSNTTIQIGVYYV